MLSYDDAVSHILSSIQPLPSMLVPLEFSPKKILSDDLIAPFSLPRFDNSQMDGYAVIAADFQSVSAEAPVRLKVVSEVQAGSQEKGRIQSGQCSRIFTGAPLPEGADSVIAQEDVSRQADVIVVVSSVEQGQFVRLHGEDIEQGGVAIRARTQIRPYEISLMAAFGMDSVNVGSFPRIAIISTGNELVATGNEKIGEFQVYDSNSTTLDALIAREGAGIVHAGMAEDSQAETEVALKSIRHSPDLIITCGGVSVGDYDYIRPAVLALGGTLDFIQVAIRPGKPTVFGNLNGIPFFGLPGNPVSAMITFELFVRPAILRTAGYPVERCCRPMIDAILSSEIGHEPGRKTFARGKVEFADATIRVTPGNRQRSDQVSGMSGSDALIVIPEDVKTLAAESKVKVMLLD